MNLRHAPRAATIAFVPLALLGATAFAAGPRGGTFTATAYALHGKTATGDHARPGIVAADPDVLPLGTRIRVEGAGKYSGNYEVGDTGAAVKGRRIDLRVPSAHEARRFGRRTVHVQILTAD